MSSGNVNKEFTEPVNNARYMRPEITEKFYVMMEMSHAKVSINFALYNIYILLLDWFML